LIIAERFDILVIGGGIHGVGVAQAGAAAGYSVLLLEMTSLAAGTSSRSSKLIHGGLRYLESFELGLVRESLHERELLLELAPGLVYRQQFILPVYAQTSRRPMTLRAGLSLYTLLAGFRRKTGFRSLPRRRWSQLDGLRLDGLQHVFQYWDAQTDDRRLTEAVMRSAESLGAVCCCPAEFLAAEIAADHCRSRYRWRGSDQEVESAVIVNAAGPWASAVAARIEPEPPTPAVDLIQGTHIELPGTLQHGVYYLEAPEDGRAVFVLPWRDHTLLGTTERLYVGDPAQVQATPEEIGYLMNVYGHYFPGRSRQPLDQWAGLRVLPASRETASRRSRETQLPVDDPAHPRVISVFGGKLTGYRATAEKVMHRLQATLAPRNPRADTRTLRLVED
jgi:glycerol-3-phosphate dehydrogenase